MRSRPNILWIVTTQWRASACGFAGDPNARTPHLDALAARSTNYTQAVTPHPFGPFARAAMLTGVPSPENGVRDYFDPLPTDARTIAHELRARGYATAFFGKWHLARRDPTAALVGHAHAKTIVPPEARGGFETWEGFESGFLLNDPWLHGSRLPEPRQFRGYQSEVLCERAAEWIAAETERNSKSEIQNWFALLSLEPPHPPYDAPAAGVAARDPREIVLPANVPRGGEIEARVRRELAGYYAHLEATDRALGKILLPSVDAENTLVVFTSVHGDMHGAHGLLRKGWPHEESVRVPLLIGGGRREAGGRKNDAAVSLVDLPELMRAEIDGALAKSEKDFARISMPSVVALPHQCDRVWCGVRSPTRKLVLGPDGAPWLFFDLARDPLEQRNLVGEPRWRDEIESLRRLASAVKINS
ncbi:MAG TPA: sulfatase-like hydrolase/transferase [Opitutaceae bacterium]|nr:sulfatase-like hydrolase/transferase [Opitutaceae bacterium]